MNANSDPALWQRIESFRDSLQTAACLLSEAGTLARNAENYLTNLERQKGELAELRSELACARQRCDSLETEKRRLEEDLFSVSEPARLALSGLESRVQALQNELEQTRITLGEERERRCRAIQLIRPNAAQEMEVAAS